MPLGRIVAINPNQRRRRQRRPGNRQQHLQPSIQRPRDGAMFEWRTIGFGRHVETLFRLDQICCPMAARYQFSGRIGARRDLPFPRVGQRKQQLYDQIPRPNAIQHHILAESDDFLAPS